MPSRPIWSPAERANLARRELDRQRQAGEWSGLVSTSGSPIYTLQEIAKAVVKELAATIVLGRTQ